MVDKCKNTCVKFLQDSITQKYQDLFIFDRIIPEILGGRFWNTVYLSYEKNFELRQEINMKNWKSDNQLMRRMVSWALFIHSFYSPKNKYR